MGEGFLDGVALGFLLEVVVADLGGAVDGLHQVAVLDGIEIGALIVGPDAGVEVGLELDADAHPVRVGLVHPRHLLMGLAQGAEEVLHVVAHLMGDDIRIGEVAVGPELLPHGGEEAQVDVQFLVAGAVERAHGGLSRAASRGGGAGIENQGGGAVSADAVLSEIGAPHVFGGGEDLAGELGERLVLGRGFIAALLGRLDAAAVDHALDHVSEGAALQEHDQRDKGDAAQSDSGGGAAAHSSAVFHIGTFPSSIKFHSVINYLRSVRFFPVSRPPGRV